MVKQFIFICRYLAFNYISRAHTQHDAIQQLGELSCQNSRSLILSKIESLKNHPESAVLDLFGKNSLLLIYIE